MLQNLQLGFSVALTPEHVLFCFIGALMGTVVGVLPGLGPVTTIAMLLPFTFKIPPIASLIMLSGIYYGAHHAGSTTAIMLNMPGEPTSIVICLDGHPMARRGRAGVALCIAALASFFAGCVSVLVIAMLAPPLAQASKMFGAPEYAAMIVMALATVAALSTRSQLTTIGMAVLGLLVGTVGTDVNSGVIRFSFGADGLSDGIGFVPAAVGLFAIAETVIRFRDADRVAHLQAPIRSLIPSREELKAAIAPILRGTALGSALGVLPGTGPLLSSFAAYALEKQIARDPAQFGQGAIAGVAAPEAANNAAALTHFVPMLTLGIPAGAAMALMLGALTIQGIVPGPQVMVEHADLFWGLVASMWIGNMMLLVLNLPLVGLWVRLLTIPYRILYPAILVFCCIGVYSVNNSGFDVLVAMVFGAIGYVFRVLDCDPAPTVLALVLGPLLEENVRRSLLLSQGDPLIFVTHPISLVMLLATGGLLLLFSLPTLRRTSRRTARGQT